MIIRNKRVAAIAVGLALSALASPSFAQRSEDHMSAARAAAVHECNLRAQKYTQHTWGDVQIYAYRACMAEHGQQE
jgi:exopolyphosphatase/pppGpp-phosphohydrolase